MTCPDILNAQDRHNHNYRYCQQVFLLNREKVLRNTQTHGFRLCLIHRQAALHPCFDFSVVQPPPNSCSANIIFLLSNVSVDLICAIYI